MLVPRSLLYVVGRSDPMLRIDAALCCDTPPQTSVPSSAGSPHCGTLHQDLGGVSSVSSLSLLLAGSVAYLAEACTMQPIVWEPFIDYLPPTKSPVPSPVFSACFPQPSLQGGTAAAAAGGRLPQKAASCVPPCRPAGSAPGSALLPGSTKNLR